MRVRELTDAEREALRQKGLEKADKLIEDLRNRNLSSTDFLTELSKTVERAEYTVTHCRENFNEAGEYQPKDGQHKDDLSDDVLQRMFCCGVTAEATHDKLSALLVFEKASSTPAPEILFCTDYTPVRVAAVVIGVQPAYK